MWYSNVHPNGSSPSPFQEVPSKSRHKALGSTQVGFKVMVVSTQHAEDGGTKGEEVVVVALVVR